jgi:import receptor subunit TOM22
MVKITLVNEGEEVTVDQNEFEAAAAGVDEKDADYTDTEDDGEDFEDDDDFDVANETMSDRLVALKDVIPPQYRSQLVAGFNGARSLLSSTFSVGGKALWVITTSSLLLGVPLSLSIISEQQLIEMEKEMKLSQSANDVLAPGAEGGFQSPAQPGAPVA